METQDSLEYFREFAARRGVIIEQITATGAIDLMADFYREVRVEDCAIDAHGDMLLFQWGIFDWGGDGELFYYDITRQMIPEPEEPDEELHAFIGQLSLTLKFEPSEELRAIGEGNRWCNRPDDLGDFLAFIQGNEATARVIGLAPKVVRLMFQDAE